jgi:hypothetical protein
MVHAPNAETRAASGPTLHEVRWSCGLVVTDGDPGDAFSFAIRTADVPGARPSRQTGIIEVAGWAFAGPVDLEAIDNPPPSALAVLTVHIDNSGPEPLGLVRELIGLHVARYGECRVWARRDASDTLKRWVAGGCPDDLVAPTDEQLAQAAEVHHGQNRQPTRRGPGWEVSEPIAEERSSETVLTPQDQDRQELAEGAAERQTRMAERDVAAGVVVTSEPVVPDSGLLPPGALIPPGTPTPARGRTGPTRLTDRWGPASVSRTSPSRSTPRP